MILIYYQDQPALYARIEGIEPDIKKDWYHVTLLMLTIPTQTVTWILREAYIDGAPFTMGGRPMRLEGVERVVPEKGPAKNGPTELKKDLGKSGTVIPFKKPQ